MCWLPHQANTYFLVIIVFRTTGRTGVCYKHIAVDKDTTAHQVIETALKKFQFEVSSLIDGLGDSGTWAAPVQPVIWNVSLRKTSFLDRQKCL